MRSAWSRSALATALFVRSVHDVFSMPPAANCRTHTCAYLSQGYGSAKKPSKNLIIAGVSAKTLAAISSVPAGTYTGIGSPGLADASPPTSTTANLPIASVTRYAACGLFWSQCHRVVTALDVSRGTRWALEMTRYGC